ncbi:polymorphic toxin type 25 domain-containing protein [Brenneria tiliae]|uniref:polymorphic toxin type 25 domain-containing protein n=1 Tax=Brenneria tiliae TaxID=2914984 RepID=UPI0032046927
MTTQKDYDIGLGLGAFGISTGKEGLGFSIGFGPSLGWSGISVKPGGVEIEGNGKVGEELYKYEF